MMRRVLRYGLTAAAFAAAAWVSTSHPAAQYGGGGNGGADQNAKLAARGNDINGARHGKALYQAAVSGRQRR